MKVIPVWDGFLSANREFGFLLVQLVVTKKIPRTNQYVLFILPIKIDGKLTISIGNQKTVKVNNRLRFD